NWVTLSEGESGTVTYCEEEALKPNACPTSPAGKVTPFCAVPLFAPTMSLALPSPGHQLTMFGGGGTHDGVGVGVTTPPGEPVTMTPGSWLLGRALFHRFCPNTTSAREMPVKQIATPSKRRGWRNADWEEKIFLTQERFTSPETCKSRQIFRKLRKKSGWAAVEVPGYVALRQLVTRLCQSFRLRACRHVKPAAARRRSRTGRSLL